MIPTEAIAERLAKRQPVRLATFRKSHESWQDNRFARPFKCVSLISDWPSKSFFNSFETVTHLKFKVNK